MGARILAGRDQEQAAALPVLAFRLRRPLTIGTRSVNCTNLDDGTELKRLQLRPTLLDECGPDENGDAFPSDIQVTDHALLAASGW
jgi:hypothetical protein